MIYAQGMGMPVAVGTAADIADEMEHYMDDGGAATMLIATYTPGCFEEFVDLVVPELQRRGRFRTRYNGTTLREPARGMSGAGRSSTRRKQLVPNAVQADERFIKRRRARQLALTLQQAEVFELGDRVHNLEIEIDAERRFRPSSMRASRSCAAGGDAAVCRK